MKTKKILVVLLAVVICISALSVGLHISATETSNTVTPSEKFDKESVYMTFEADKISQTTLVSADWKNFDSYSNKSSNWANWDDQEFFTLPCKLTTYYRTTDAESTKGVIIYVVGHLEHRVSTESDTAIINDYLDEGYIVILTDFLENENAVSPYLDSATGILRYEVAVNGQFVGDYYKTDFKYDTFVLPAGYRMVRDIVYFDVNQSASKGTLERIISVYNGDTIQNRIANMGKDWGKAITIDEVMMPNGYPINDVESGNRDKYMKYKLDIYYPSMPDEGTEVPVFAWSHSSATRTQISSGVVGGSFVTGALFGGYAYAVYDHEWTPLMLGRDAWAYTSGFTIQDQNGVKTHTAAIRCIKYYAETYGYSNEKIGVIGHSKSSYTITLSGPNPEKFYESFVYSGQKRDDNYGEQPYLTYEDGTPISSDVTCIYHSMGAGSIRRQHFLTPANVPTYIACGVLDDANPAPKDYWEQEFKDYQEMDIPFAAAYMPEVGHTITPNTVDPIYGYNYYKSLRAFFDYYLKGVAPEVMYTGIETDGTVDMNDKGLFIYFSAPITEWSLLDGVSVTDASGNDVEGIWIADCGNTRWVFETNSFIKGNQYTLTLDDTAADINGMVIKEGVTKSFVAK